MQIIIADRQDITQAGLLYICHGMNCQVEAVVHDKQELADVLTRLPEAVVVLDYTLFDIQDTAELLILSERFDKVQWIMFSEELSIEFVRILIGSNHRFSILVKESSLPEIQEALRQALLHRRYICHRTTEMLLAPISTPEEVMPLTKTEKEILKDIALGLTTKEIAEKRFSSFHTVNTHRKNIFRKIHVNNVHEATKYALRAGMVDSAEYYI